MSEYPLAGFTKNDREKPRTDLLPPDALMAVAEVLAYGAEKYDADNWKKGTDWHRYYGAALRHLFAYWEGEDLDESGYLHLAHAACNVLFALAYQLRGIGSDDRDKGVKAT